MTIRVALIIFLLGPSLDGYCCKCGEIRPIEGSFKGSSVIVHGQVVSKKLVSFDKTMDESKVDYVKNKLKNEYDKLEFFSSDRVIEVQLVVIESFKGSHVGDTITIYTSALAGSCRYWFDIGKEYIVYTLKKSWLYSPFLTEEELKGNFEKENTYWAHPCTRTTEYNDSEAKDLRKVQNKVGP